MNIAADNSTGTSRPASCEELSTLIGSSDEWAVGGLMRLYQFQTPDEQAGHKTEHLNACGFNALDAGVLSDIAEFYRTRGYLTPRQLVLVKSALKKYVKQMIGIGVRPLPLKSYVPAEKKSIFMTASLLIKNEKPSGIKVKFGFPRGDPLFGEMVGRVRSLPDRRFVSDDLADKYWRVGLSLESGKSLKEWGFEFAPELQKWLDDLTKPVNNNNLDLTGLDLRLFPFQREGIAFIESRNGRALIGDDMGLGKTAQAISWLRIHPELRPAVVVCPASLKLNWKKEFGMWGSEKEKVQVISGKKNGCDLLGDVIIINYDILASWLESIRIYSPKVVIFDESHYTKNSGAQRTHAAKRLAKEAPHVIALSGTPIVNRPIEFFNTINMIRPDVFPNFWRFAHEFCGARYNKFGWDFTGATNMDKLHKLLIETIMLRRLKKDVLKDLPPKISSVVPFEIVNRKEYDSASADIVAWIRKNEGAEKAEKASQAEVLVEFEKLKQLAVRGKMEAVKEWVEDFLENGEKLVLFATHISTLDFLQSVFPEVSVRLDGSTDQKMRQEVVDRFQNDDKIRLFLGNIKAAGVGITLTAASNVGFVELPWTPGDYEQASDRLHRIGQKDTVNVWTLVAQNTVEEDIADLLSRKAKVLSAVLDGKKADEGSLLSELIQKMKKGRNEK